MNDVHQRARELMQGGYDLHVHTAPSVFDRELDAFELVCEAEKLSMAGVLLKSHYEPTAARAALVNLKSGVFAKAYGGVTLNWPVGGLNPYVVESTLKLGGIMVWMPTRDSLNSLKFGDMPGDFFRRPGITIFDESQKIKPEVYDILEVVKRYHATLATGHLGMAEAVKLCIEGRKMGVQMVLTHPEFPRTLVPCDVQVELARQGVLIEKNWLNVRGNVEAIAKMADTIRAVGAESAYIATDSGQKGLGRPTQEMLCFVEALLKQGVSDNEIHTMTHTVPKAIVG